VSDVTARWLHVRDEVHAETARLGRAIDEVTIVVVTKFHPVDVIAELLDAGATHFGESRHQDAAPKVAALEGSGAIWHFVGQVQSNKARAIARYASYIHSLDRESVVDALSTADDQVGGFIEVNLTDDPGRGGVNGGDELLRLAERIATTDTIDLRGVMAVAPQDEAPDRAFERLATFSAMLQQAIPSATAISAGMSGDWKQALAHGATHLRIGTSITGNRPIPR
jgi:pyridoxal phosphate enzyme (YggS family)